MPRQITLGALSPDTTAAEELALPILEGLAPLGIVQDALDHVAVNRRGVGVISEKGGGKSEAFALAVERFHAAEFEKEDADASYRLRRVVTLVAPRATSYRDVVIDLLRAVIGTSPVTRIHGRPKQVDELRADLIAHMADRDVAVLGIDEAERLSDDGLTALRDILSDAEAAASDRRAAGHLRARGVGVVALGTPALRARIERSDEAGQRWAGCVSIPPLSAAEVPPIYLAFFPRFRDAALAAGVAAWHADVIQAVMVGRPHVTLRLIANHAREYFRLLVRNSTASYTRVDVPFDRDVFIYAAESVNWTIPTTAHDRRAA